MGPDRIGTFLKCKLDFAIESIYIQNPICSLGEEIALLGSEAGPQKPAFAIKATLDLFYTDLQGSTSMG